MKMNYVHALGRASHPLQTMKLRKYLLFLVAVISLATLSTGNAGMFSWPVTGTWPGYLTIWQFNPDNSAPGAAWSGWTQYWRTDSTGSMESFGDDAIYSTPYDSALQFTGKMMTAAGAYDYDRAYNDQYYEVKGSYLIDGDLAYWVEGIPERMNSAATLQQRSDGDHADSQWGDPVDTATGVQTFDKTVISVQGALPIDFTIEFRTRLAPTHSVLGDGWAHNYQAALTVSSTTATVAWTPNRTEVFERSSTGTFSSQSESARRHSLVENADGSYTLTLDDHSRYNFDAAGALQWISKSGKYIDLTYGPHGLARITDRGSGKYLELAYAFTAQAVWDISAISDGQGRQATLQMVWNLLYSVTDANGNETRFSYRWPGGFYAAPYQWGEPSAENPNAMLFKAEDLASNSILFYNDYDEMGRIIAQAGGMNGGTYFEYDTASSPGNIITTVTKPDGFTRKYTHNSKLLLTKVVDENNNATTHTYDTAGQRLTSTDPLDHTTTYTYDPQGHVSTVTDPSGAVTQMQYDAQGNLSHVIDALNQTATYTFDSNSNVLSSTDAKGQTATFTYNAGGQVLTVTYPGGGVDTFTYASGLPATFTDRTGNLQSYQYDPAGRIATLTNTPTPTSPPLTTSFTYDGMGNMLTMTPPICPDALYGPFPPTWSWSYDSLGHKSSETDPLGWVTNYTFDQYGMLLQKIDPTGGVTQYEHNPSNEITAVTTGYWRRTEFTRDPAGRVTAIIDPLGHTTQFTYDAAGNKIATYNSAGTKVSEVAYDNRDLPTGVKDAYDVTETVQFDALRRVTSKTDRLGRTTTYSLDPVGQLTGVQNPESFVTGQSWNANGFRIAFTNAGNATTGLTVDPAGRLSAIQTALGKQSVYNYDSPTSTSQPSSIVDANGTTTALVYDNALRLVTSTDPVSQIDRLYDVKGRLVTVTEGSKVITRDYDAVDRMINFTDGDGNSISYWNDDIGELSTIIYPDGYSVSYGYDAAGRMTGVYTWDGAVCHTTSYSYDEAGRLATTTRPNGTVETRSYDLNDRLLSIVDTDSSGNMIASETLTRDVAGRITSESTTPAPWLQSETLNSMFSYDLSDRLTSRDDTDGSSNAVMTRAITFDNTSNITSSVTNPLLVPGLVPENLAMTYDVDNRLSSFNGQSTQFDNSGNLTSGPLGVSPPFSSLTYDARNRLTSAGGLSFGYDAENRRTSLTSAAGTTHYIFNPRPALDQLLVKILPDGTVTHYIYGIGLIGEQTGSNYRVYHYDSRGSTVAMTDASGAVIGRASYGAYGEVLQKDAALTTSFLFNGQYGVQTDESGLLYMRARYYSPLIKRFINQDSVLGSINSSASLNRFAYANGDPASLIDPFGLCAEKAGKGFFGSLLDTLLNIQGIKDSLWIYDNADDWREKVIGAAAVPILALDALSNLVPVVGEEKAALETSAKVAIEKAIEHEAADVTISIVANSERVLAADAVRFHHGWPKYLGGDMQQILEPLPKSMHDAFHSGLDKIIPRQAGTSFYEGLSPVARRQMLQDLGDYTKAFDAKNGTHLYDAMVREGFPGGL
ncbi:MAG: hypothetical protein QOJ45_277 [Verrucomicrobiota bacterium]